MRAKMRNAKTKWCKPVALEPPKPKTDAPPRVRARFKCGTDWDTLEAAVAMVAFHSMVRCFGYRYRYPGPRYRYVVK